MTVLVFPKRVCVSVQCCVDCTQIVSWDSMRFELFIAARYLRAKRLRQAGVGAITAISVIGVAAGVASLIIALAITNGMRRDLQERLGGSTLACRPDAADGR